MEDHPKRKKVRLSPEAYKKGHAFSITIATWNRYPWFQKHPKLTDRMTKLLVETAAKRNTEIYAWCIMPDHLHMLLKDADIIGFVREIKGRLVPFARKLMPGQALWQRSFYDHALRREETLKEVARYIWENPVRENLVNRAPDYPWSGSLTCSDWREFYDGML